MPDPVSMAELRTLIEGIHSNSPQRLQLAKTYLDTLAQTLKGLETMGQRIAFTLLPPPPPIEYPKMVQRPMVNSKGKTILEYKVVNNSMEEELWGFQGFQCPPKPEPEPEPEPTPVGEPPVIAFPGVHHGNR